MPAWCAHILASPHLPACPLHPAVQTHISDMDAKRAPQPDWATVRYMVAAIQYAGRITDDYDRVLMGELSWR